jgi:hypothetical protein
MLFMCSDASSRLHNHAGPLAGWKLTQIAQSGKIDETGNRRVIYAKSGKNKDN